MIPATHIYFTFVPQHFNSLNTAEFPVSSSLAKTQCCHIALVTQFGTITNI